MGRHLAASVGRYTKGSLPAHKRREIALPPLPELSQAFPN